jgi:AraC-like DNA-binding protein
MASLARHQNLFNEGDRYAVVDDGSQTRVSFEPWGPERPGQIQMAEKTVAQIQLILSLAEPAISPIAVQFAHAERPGSEELTKVLGLEPSFGAECTAVVVSSEHMRRPVRGADPDLFRFFDRHLSHRLDGGPGTGAPTRPDRTESYGSMSRRAVRDALHRGEYSAEQIAAQLGVPLRTLQRKLAEEGTQLKSIVEDVRRVRAQRLLATGMSVGEVAILLGYAGAPPFARAFKRWYGTTPASWRDEGRAQR